MDERLLDLYNTELRHLRETAGEFAREFPKIAGRLSVDPEAKETCPDPYVERLLEGFAFLAARVHLKLDSEYPRFTQGLLETVYPDYLCPIPSMGIVRFEPEEQEASLAQGFLLPRGTILRSQLAKGERTACTFTTSHPVRLLPVTVTEGRYFTRDIAELKLPQSVTARAAFRIRLRKTISNPFKDIKADPLTIHIRGEGELANQIYEQIFAHKVRVLIASPSDPKLAASILPADSIRRVGFRTEEALLPPSPRGFEGYRLLREYFAFPQRFLFFEIADFQQALSRMPGDEVDIIIALDEADERLAARVDKTCFELFCTPAVNLFEKTLDRVQISEKFSEFHVVPDRNRPLDFEIYQISSVNGYGETPDQERAFHSFYHARDTDLESSAYYSLQRVPRLFSDRERLTRRRSSYAGTDVYLSIVDADMAPYHPELTELGVRAWCTNRHLPIQMAKGIGQTDFTTELSAPISSIRILQGPTLPRPSVVLAGQNAESPHIPSGRYAWRVISHLSLNYLSLRDTEGGNGAEALRDLLRIYSDPRDREMLKQIDGLRSVTHRPILRRIETPGPIAFGRGLEINVLFDENSFEGQGVFILGAVLEQFFTRYVSLNSFTETVISTQQRKEIMRWPTQMGKRQIL
ncbi:MAG TPA: type VI secretion system baseplate subunit TssF [Verrucomicrobiae bacterium]|nr:type VI secretion system baseplate subunit TssF [Verrucomicrobiae bacterium]